MASDDPVGALNDRLVYHRYDHRGPQALHPAGRLRRSGMKYVVVESPYAGDVEENLKYLRACLKDCLERGETPYASHGLLTQPGVLDDLDPEQRKWGIEAGLAWHDRADLVVFYVDRGWSGGMAAAFSRCMDRRMLCEVRTLLLGSKQGR